MGHIRTVSVSEGRSIEQRLHLLFEDKLDTREWFSLSPEDVVSALKLFSSTAFIALGLEAFEIISYDRNAIPEFASPWLWDDFDCYEFCPSCGWACGWTCSENHGDDVCFECGASESNYDTPEPVPED